MIGRLRTRLDRLAGQVPAELPYTPGTDPVEAVIRRLEARRAAIIAAGEGPPTPSLAELRGRVAAYVPTADALDQMLNRYRQRTLAELLAAEEL